MRPAFPSLTRLLKPSLRNLSSLPPSPEKPICYGCRFGPEGYRRLLEDSILEKNFGLGSQIHSHLVITGMLNDSFLVTSLITLYSSSGDISAAESIFNRSQCSNAFQLNAMIRGYTCNGLYQEAIDAFHRKRKALEPDSHTFSCVLKACGCLSDLQQGKRLHGLAVECGFGSDVFVLNSLIYMYVKCGSFETGLYMFERMPKRDIVSWNSVISACAQNRFEFEAMIKVQELIGSGLRPDSVTIICVLIVCSFAPTVRELHGYAITNGVISVSRVRNAFISAYGKCSRIRDARLLFDNSNQRDKVAWNAIISGYAQNSLYEESIWLLREMKASGIELDAKTYSGIISSFSQNSFPREAIRFFEELLGTGLKLDVITVTSILPSISDLQGFDYCREIHAYSYRHRLEPDRKVRNALVSVYSKCGSIHDAYLVFKEIKDRDIISWSSMVGGYAQNGHDSDALNIFRQMIAAEIEPNPISITSILSACAGVSGLRQGREVHLWAVKSSFEGQTFVGSALIDMYAKCGRIKDARMVFDLVKEKNLVTWNSMIGGYATHGLGKDALEIFKCVKEPDKVSFIAVLSACSHGGLVEEGIKIFSTMKNFKVKPTEGHYVCMVDLLARSGRLDQALDLVRTMPVETTTELWGSLLGACKIHSNLEIGTHIGFQIIEAGCNSSGYFVLLSNILADFGRWSDVEVMRKLMKEKGLKKALGCSWIEVDKQVHSFTARERAKHPEPQWESLIKFLRFLNDQMKGLYS